MESKNKKKNEFGKINNNNKVIILIMVKNLRNSVKIEWNLGGGNWIYILYK